jgi:hypothetical protein
METDDQGGPITPARLDRMTSAASPPLEEVAVDGGHPGSPKG